MQPCLSQVFLGDQSVGKTSIITRFMYDKFDNTYQVSSSTAEHYGSSVGVLATCSSPSITQAGFGGSMHNSRLLWYMRHDPYLLCGGAGDHRY